MKTRLISTQPVYCNFVNEVNRKCHSDTLFVVIIEVKCLPLLLESFQFVDEVILHLRSELRPRLTEVSNSRVGDSC